jgi:hypothetical protein
VTSLTADSAKIDQINLVDNRVTARIWQPGEWRMTSAQGCSGELTVREVPTDQPLIGSWKVTFPENLGAPSDIVMKTLADWTTHENPGVRYFSGTARYHLDFTLSPNLANNENQVILDLGEVKEVAEVHVNGHHAGILWKNPTQADITKMIRPGLNRLEIAVTNVWNNRIVGDLNQPEHPPITRTNIMSKFNAKSPLLPSGLLGPVTLRFPVTAITQIQR